MGHRVTASMFGLAFAAGLSGCSLIYNPSNLPDPAGDGPQPPDVMPDSEDKLDADPGLLAIQSVFPDELFEGTGTGGSRKGVLTVIGTNIVAGAKVSVVVHAGETGDPKITIDDDATDVAANGNLVAAPFTLDINDQLAQDATIRLDVTVTQPNGATTVTATLTEKTAGADDAVLVIKGLDELTGDATPTGTKEYSEVDATSITAPLASAVGGGEPVVIRARGGITVSGAITANGSGITGGAGGHNGGTGGPILNPGMAGAGPGGPGTGGKPDGGGGGFAEKGGGATGGPASGQPEIVALGGANRSSGGSGGNGRAVVNGGAGGFGGGGGGAIELTADGDISITTIDANGASGEDVGGTGGDGGGGSGGLILLRGARITATAINVAGGMGANIGSVGRTRADTGVSAAPSGVGFRGPMLDNMTPIISKNDELMLTVFGKPNTSFVYKIFGFSGNVSNDLEGSIGPLGTNMFPIGSPLFRGLNRVCAFVPGADLEAQLPEAKNCIEVVYLFTPD